jgi:acetolactate synthase-1/2/3 large subunit
LACDRLKKLMKKLTGAQIVIESLIAEGVEVIFGYPGGAILPTYDALLDSKIKHVLVRHEQGATHMAEGYARVSGRPGVVIVTSGPGAQRRYRDCRRLHGFDPDGRDFGTGRDGSDR